LFFHKFFSTKLAQKDAATAKKRTGKGREDEDMLQDDSDDEMSGEELPASVADEDSDEEEDEDEDDEDDEEEDDEPGSDPEEDEIWKVSDSAISFAIA